MDHAIHSNVVFWKIAGEILGGPGEKPAAQGTKEDSIIRHGPENRDDDRRDKITQDLTIFSHFCGGAFEM